MRPDRPRPFHGRAAIVLIALAGLPGLAACGSGGSGTAPTDTASGSTSGSTAATTGKLTLLAYDAFTEPEALADFTKQTGIEVAIAKGGDAGTLVNKAILTAGRPEGDVLWGLDNTLLSRALGEDVFVPYESPELGALDP
jgi:thiamine transport system substrate-binding protein